MQFSEKEIDDLAVALSRMVTWRGCMAGGKFDEHYNTPEYSLYSDEWEPYHIVATYKPTGQVVLRAGTGYCEWYGEAVDYRDLWREVENHNKWVVREATKEALPMEEEPTPPVLLTVKGDTPPAKVTWTKREVQGLCISVGVLVALVTAIVLTILV